MFISSRILKAIILFVLVATTIPSMAQSTSSIDINRIKRATVFIYQARNQGNDLIITCVSTGTIVSYNGLILTNAHNTVRDSTCNGDTLIVAINVDLNEPPIPKYRADIAQVDKGLDIALLQITRELDGRLIAEGTLPILPFVEIGDSSEVTIDQNIAIFGYNNIDNQPVDITRGTITAFIAEPRGGNRSWFKTRSTIPGTMSGGGAYNSQGQLIGIPTTASVTLANSDAGCKFIEDSNQDGFINNNDQCIPIGGFISSIRPSNFARSLIRSASLELNVDVLTIPEIRANPLDPPRFSRLFFSPSVVDGLPSTVVGSLPANTNSLFFFFDYANMTSETVYELRVTRDGVPDSIFSLPPVRWSGNERGVWYIGSRDQPWANGVYEFNLLINGLAAGSQRVVIGGGASVASSFSNVVFGLLDLQGNILGNGYVLPTGSIASARFVYANMTDGMDWTALWYFNDVEVGRTNDIWSWGTNGSTVVNLRPQGGLFPGTYRLELYIEGALSATADFVVAGAQEGPLPIIFTNAHYTIAQTPFEALNTPSVSTFPNSIEVLYALFDWQQIAPGTVWTVRWLVDNELFFELTESWITVESGKGFLLSINNPPDGTYTVEFLVNDLQIIETTATIGIGQLPIDRFAEAEGTPFGGTIIDSATQNGISNVTAILISEDFSVSDFVWDQEQVFALATTDRNGDFQFDRPLTLDTPYSLVIEASGYLPVTVDGFELDKESANPLIITVELVHD
jgi:hypothetical protein